MDDVKVVLLRRKASLDQVFTVVKIRLGVCAFLPKKGERCEVWVEGDWWMVRVVKKITDKKMVFDTHIQMGCPLVRRRV